MVYTNPLLQKTFSPIGIMFQKILLKWCFFNGVARTLNDLVYRWTQY